MVLWSQSINEVLKCKLEGGSVSAAAPAAGKTARRVRKSSGLDWNMPLSLLVLVCFGGHLE